jgi:hypothetical protein
LRKAVSTAQGHPRRGGIFLRGSKPQVPSATAPTGGNGTGKSWPTTAFALKELTAAEEARIGALVKKAVS